MLIAWYVWLMFLSGSAIFAMFVVGVFGFMAIAFATPSSDYSNNLSFTILRIVLFLVMVSVEILLTYFLWWLWT